jgi:uncharacterized membrane protein YvlD (DUF360 family)
MAGAAPRRTSVIGALARVLGLWLLAAATLLVTGAIVPGVDVDGFGAALAAAAIIGLLNALVWPVVLRLALPITVLTLGFAVVLVNAVVVLVVTELDTGLGLHVESFSAALIVTFVLSAVSTAASSLLAIDDDGFWYRHVITRHGARAVPAGDLETPGILFLEIDGLAHDVLKRAVRDGNAPTLARWLHSGSHRLTRWQTDWSSQTGACQAGLLHGNNDDMPAFRWWEKERGAAIVTNHPRDAAELERRHSDGRGLLFADGASRANIVSGDAPHSLLTMSTVLNRDRHGRIGQDYFSYFAKPYNVTRTIVLVAREIVSELWSASRQRRLDVRPRIHRGFAYALVRAWATVIQRDLQVAAVIGDMYAGRPVVYTTFLAYDEVAHHSGVERPDTLATLRQLDRQIGRIANAAERSKRRYALVVLSDHGQSQGATFLDRYGITLEQLVKDAAQTSTMDATGQPSEALGYLGAAMTEATAGPGRVPSALRRLGPGDEDGGAIAIGEHAAPAEADDQPPEVAVMASGCLGLISFPREHGRVTRERIEQLYPDLLPALRNHPGIGFVLVSSAENGATVLGRSGEHRLRDGRVQGDDPLAPFGPTAARHVLRTDGFEHCPDIVVNSTYWRDSDEVAAFEELVGSHGGLGGEQSRPFLLHPVELELPPSELIGAEAVHRELRRWLVQLGHEEYGRGPAETSTDGPPPDVVVPSG